MSATPGEKRRAPRIQPFVAPCHLVVGERRVSGYLTDVSPLGCRVSCDSEPPEAGAVVVVEVRFRGRPALTRLPSLVKWRSGSPQGSAAGVCGLVFERLRAEEARVLEKVVDEFRRRAAQIA